MFSEMINELESGTMPEVEALKGRCRAALSKKLAIVSQPPTYWIDDPKRNPLTEHLLWAILFTGDSDMLDVIIGIVIMEQEEMDGMMVEAFIQQSVSRLLALAPNESFREKLKRESALVDYIN